MDVMKYNNNMQQIPEKQKKQLITMSLAGAVLLAGIVAGFLVVQNQQFIQNKAATTPISCQLPQGKCTVPPAGANGYSPFIINVWEIGTDGGSKIITTSAQYDPNDPDGPKPVAFTANPLMRYKCEVVATGNSTCTTSSEKTAPLCKTPNSPPDSPNNPPKDPPPGNPDTPPGKPNIPIPDDPEVKACACAADGGTLDCNTLNETRVEGYDGPTPGEKGLIVINPRYKKGPGMCFKCVKLVVNDGVNDIEEYPCMSPIPTSGFLLPEPTKIRLHVADGAQCRNYTIKVVGEKINASAAEPTGAVCGNCQGKICCPKCADPVALTDCGSFVDKAGKTVQCDFTVNPMCGSVGSAFTVNPINNTNYEFTYDDPYDKSDDNILPPHTKHTYKNAGVYDISMSCNNDPSGGSEHVCTKRITIGCGADVPTPEVSKPTTTGTCVGIKIIHTEIYCIPPTDE